MNERDKGHVRAKRRITRVVRERKMPVLSLYAKPWALRVSSWWSMSEGDALAGATERRWQSN